jgi:hypothetical protein
MAQVTVFSLGGIGSPCCCGSSPIYFECDVCLIPRTNLTVSWTNVLSGPGSITLVYSASGPKWVSGCDPNGIQYQLVCDSNLVEFQAIYWITGSCASGTGVTQYCSNLRAAPLGLTLVSLTCGADFDAELTVTSASCPVIAGAGYTSYSVTV